MKIARKLHVQQPTTVSTAKIKHTSTASTASQETPPLPAALPSKLLDAAAKKAQARELSLHAQELGVPLDVDVAKNIQAAELAKGHAADSRVDASDMDRAVRFSEQAALLTPAHQSDLFGFTRVVDAKLLLAPKTLEHLARACGDDAALKRAIDVGPGDGAISFTPPKDRIELVASLVRQLALGAGASKQLTLEPSLASWLETTLESSGVDIKRAMGGAGAFAANLAFAAGVDATFYSAEPLPAAIADRFAAGVRVATKAGAVTSKQEHSSDAAARTNTAAEYSAHQHYALFGADTVRVNGQETAVVTEESGRVILGTKAKDVKPGFHGVDDKALQKLARSTDLFFFVGAHYLTQGTAAESKAEAQELARSLDVMKQANPKLLRHAQYVVPKNLENEAVVWGELKGHVDSLALNVVEVAPFTDSLFDGGLSKIDIDPNLPREAAEDPAHMLEGALALKESLDLARVALHGLEGDLVVQRDTHIDPERQKLALLKARQLASNKAANDSGEIKSAADIWPVVPSVRGTGLAALHRFADAVKERFDLSDAQRDDIVKRWWFQAPDGTTIHFVPSRGIHDRTGGTVSLGDTIDSAALIYALEPDRAPKLKHGSSFI